MNLVKTKFNFPDASLLRKTKTNKKFWQESLPANLTILGWLMVFVMGEDVIQHCPQISGDSLDTLPAGYSNPTSLVIGISIILHSSLLS